MVNFFPTHTCFDDAFEFINDVIINNLKMLDQLKEELVLVHAICKMPADGRLYAHAWVEDKKKKQCIFKGIVNGKADYFGADMKEYHEHIMPQEITLYTVMQAVIENRKNGTLGPWKQEYKKLCRYEK